MTHICEKYGLCYATAKILQCGRISKGTVECAVEKDSRKKKRETADTSRTHKDAKMTLK